MTFNREALTVLFIILFSPKTSFCQEKNIVDGKFIFVSSYLIEATIFDVESTYAARKNCSECFEANPIMEPFVSKGRPVAYLVQGIVNGVIIYTSYRLKAGGRKSWWLGPVVIGSAHAIAGGFNLRYVF